MNNGRRSEADLNSQPRCPRCGAFVFAWEVPLCARCQDALERVRG